MEKYIERMTDEESALTEKLIKLDGFIASNAQFVMIPDDARRLMYLQQDHMKRYLDVLKQRIKMAKEDQQA